MSLEVSGVIRCLEYIGPAEIDSSTGGQANIPYLVVESHWSQNDRVVVCTPGGEKFVCLAKDLGQAITNAINWR